MLASGLLASHSDIASVGSSSSSSSECLLAELKHYICCSPSGIALLVLVGTQAVILIRHRYDLQPENEYFKRDFRTVSCHVCGRKSQNMTSCKALPSDFKLNLKERDVSNCASIQWQDLYQCFYTLKNNNW